MSLAEMTLMTFTPAGSGSSTLAATRVTSAPWAVADRANAYPCRPVDQLPRKRTGSSSSRVPPAETSTRRPARGSPLPAAGAWLSALRRPMTFSASSNRAAGSGKRPLPLSLPVRRPTAGSTTIAPRSRSVATLCRVAGCSHISVCMAGA